MTSTSSLSRSASHAGSSVFNEPVNHQQREVADSYSISSSSSPPGSFGAAYWASREGNLGDFTSASSDSVSRTPDWVSSREVQIQPRASRTFDPFRCSSMSSTSNSHRFSIHRNYSETYSLSKKGPRAFFRRQKSDSQTSIQNVSLGGGVWPQASGQQAGGMDWSMQAFSQLVASSQREGFGLSDSPNAVNYTESLEDVSSSLERIRVSSLQNPHGRSPDLQGEVHTCGICSRLLLQKSPWSSQRMLVGNTDLPVVGVLGCGHVFHADCLEKGVPEALKCDPPCPRCKQQKDASEKPTGSAGTESSSVGNLSLKMRLSRMGPQLWRRSLSSSKLSSSKELHVEKGGNVPGEKGFFQRSHSRKQFPFLVRSLKDSGPLVFATKKVSSSAQVSPENQS